MTTIVVIDDNEPTQSLLRDLFEERGWATVACMQGARALEVVKREQPNLVFLDIWLETRTAGWEILQALKADPATRHIPVVVSSARREDLQDHRTIIEGNAAAVLVKPFSLDDVERCLQFTLAGKP